MLPIEFVLALKAFFFSFETQYKDGASYWVKTGLSGKPRQNSEEGKLICQPHRELCSYAHWDRL